MVMVLVGALPASTAAGGAQSQRSATDGTGNRVLATLTPVRLEAPAGALADVSPAARSAASSSFALAGQQNGGSQGSAQRLAASYGEWTDDGLPSDPEQDFTNSAAFAAHERALINAMMSSYSAMAVDAANDGGSSASPGAANVRSLYAEADMRRGPEADSAPRSMVI